jgi:uncharacterized membrane protein YfcA
VELYSLLAIVGFVGGVLAGWVGLGGGIILAPLLLFVPPAVGLEPLDMKAVARLTIIQSLCSTAAAGINHRRARLVHGPLVVWMGGFIAAASLTGALVSETGVVSSKALMAVFATMALVAAALMLRHPVKQEEGELLPTPPPSFSRGCATIVSVTVGFLGGMVGQSGAFLTIPLLIQTLRLPVRLAIGSSLGITFCAAMAGSFGKLLGGGPVVWPQIAVLVVGSLAGSQCGSWINHRVPATSLRYSLAILIGASALRMWFQVVA